MYWQNHDNYPVLRSIFGKKKTIVTKKQNHETQHFPVFKAHAFLRILSEIIKHTLISDNVCSTIKLR